MPRAKKAEAPASQVRLARPEEHDSIHKLLEFTRGPLLDTVEALENEREEVRSIVQEWMDRGESGKWMITHYLTRLRVALRME